MSRQRQRRSARSPRQRILAGVSLGAYLFAIVGYPVPAGPSIKGGGVPFPCQGRVCGCATAEQCMQSCCCFSVAERQAWARAQQQPLDSGWEQAPASQSRQTKRARACATTSVEPTGSCCSQPAPDGCEQSTACCRQTPSGGEDEEDASDESVESSTGSTWALGFSAARCQGASTFWLFSGAALPPPQPVTWAYGLIPFGWLDGNSISSLRRPLQPPFPPPRV